MVQQRTTPPVLRDVAEHPVFDLVPLARPGREVTHRDLQSRLIRQILEADLPQSVAPPVAPARVGRDQQLLRLRVDRPSHPVPPPPDRLHRELRRVMTDPHVDPPFVGRLIVDPVRRHLALLLVREVLRLDAPRPTVRLPFLARILVIADHFLLLGVHRDHRLAPPLERADPAVDVLELGIAIGVVLTLLGLAVGLEAVTQIDQQPADGLMAQVMPQLGQRVGQVPRTLAGPEQWGHGITAGGRIDEPLEITEQGPIGCRDRITPTPGTANPGMIRLGRHRGAVVTGLEFGDAAADGRMREIGGGGDHRDATAPQGQGLTSGPASPRLLVKERSEGVILLPDTGNHCRICHNGSIVRRCSFEKLLPAKTTASGRVTRRASSDPACFSHSGQGLARLSHDIG